METQIKTIDNLSILMNKTVTWNSQEKLQQTVKLGSADGAYTVDVSSINNIKMISIYSTSPFIVGLTKDSTLSTLEIENLFLYTPAVFDRNLIQTISITAINVSPANVEIYVYGEDEQ